MLGVTLEGALGLGDKLQFTSFPENHFRNTGEKLVDVDRVWVFDHNPYVVRDTAPDRIVNLWTTPWPAQTGVTMQQFAERPVFASLAERHCTLFNYTAYLRHPRLYRYEDLPRLPNRVVLHTTGKSLPPVAAAGEDHPRILPEDVMLCIRDKYRSRDVLQIGTKQDVDAQVTDCRGIDDIWDVVKIVAQAGVFIGVDSGPYWIAACFPEIFRKKILVQYPPEYLRKGFVPMHLLHPHVHWHDSSCLYYNRTRDDAGITYSYLKI